MVTHIVLFRYSPSIPWSKLQTHFDTFMTLPQRCLHPKTRLPLIKNFKAGINNSWEPHEKSLTHAFILEFASRADLDYYLLEDPVHIAFSKKVTQDGLVEDSVVMDIEDGVLWGNKAKRPMIFAPGVSNEGGVWKGHCHCGGVEWAVALEKAEHVLCHCDTCKMLGGGPYSLNQIVQEDAFVVLRGKLSKYTYQGASGKNVDCFFCPTCTSHAYHKQEIMVDKIIVRTALLEGGSDMPVAAEIFPEGRLAWVNDLKGALEDSGKPESNGVNGVKANGNH